MLKSQDFEVRCNFLRKDVFCIKSDPYLRPRAHRIGLNFGYMYEMQQEDVSLISIRTWV